MWPWHKVDWYTYITWFANNPVSFEPPSNHGPTVFISPFDKTFLMEIRKRNLAPTKWELLPYEVRRVRRVRRQHQKFRKRCECVQPCMGSFGCPYGRWIKRGMKTGMTTWPPWLDSNIDSCHRSLQKGGDTCSTEITRIWWQECQWHTHTWMLYCTLTMLTILFPCSDWLLPLAQDSTNVWHLFGILGFFLLSGDKLPWYRFEAFWSHMPEAHRKMRVDEWEATRESLTRWLVHMASQPQNMSIDVSGYTVYVHINIMRHCGKMAQRLRFWEWVIYKFLLFEMYLSHLSHS